MYSFELEIIFPNAFRTLFKSSNVKNVVESSVCVEHSSRELNYVVWIITVTVYYYIMHIPGSVVRICSREIVWGRNVFDEVNHCGNDWRTTVLNIKVQIAC